MATTKLRYHLLDVFTDRPFGGNQLAVFTNGRGLSSGLMQSIARELNLAETTFVLPPDDAANDYRVRIFTPETEMPMAGHPTVGTSYVLVKERMLSRQGRAEWQLKLEEQVGVIGVTVRFEEGSDRPAMIEMRQPLPVFGPRFEDRAAIAGMLSLDQADIIAELPLEVVSCGVPFLFVPVRSLAAIGAIEVRRELWNKHLKDFASPHLFVFTLETSTPEAGVHSRMFAPGLGIAEDPATGGASGPLGCYLVKYGMVENRPTVKILGEQGFEMGRPSLLHIRIEQDGGQISGVFVGGQCFYMGEGVLELDI